MNYVLCFPANLLYRKRISLPDMTPLKLINGFISLKRVHSLYAKRQYCTWTCQAIFCNRTSSNEATRMKNKLTQPNVSSLSWNMCHDQGLCQVTCISRVQPYIFNKLSYTQERNKENRISVSVFISRWCCWYDFINSHQVRCIQGTVRNNHKPTDAQNLLVPCTGYPWRINGLNGHNGDKPGAVEHLHP